MADYKLSFTEEEIDALLTKMNSGVCLPVVELSTAVSFGGSTVLSDDDSAKMSEVAALMMPCIVKFAIYDGDEKAPMALVFNNTWGAAYSSKEFMIGMTFALVAEDNVSWTMMIQQVEGG